MEKTCIEISEVIEITETQVAVVVTKTGKVLVLPIKLSEKYQDRIFIPTWLANKKGIKDKIQDPV